MRKKNQIPRIIREAIETYPDGLCFATEDGRPILVNHRMNQVVNRLLGHRVLDAVTLWAELCKAPLREGVRLDGGQEGAETGAVIQTPEGAVVRFDRKLLQDGPVRYVQIEALDVTDLYCRSRELAERNCLLQEQARRQRELLGDITRINHEKELLKVKIRVHAELGHCLVATRKALEEHSFEEKSGPILQSWKSAIRNLSNVPGDREQAPMEEELFRVARLIGCQIRISGALPEEPRLRQLLLAAIREALTNAVRHANAKQLLVSCGPNSFGYHMEITDDGVHSPGNIREGGGLSNLRARLEREGILFRVERQAGVKLTIDVPVSRDTEGEEKP